MTNHQIQENFTFPQETREVICIKYYRKIPHMGTVTGPIIAETWLSVNCPYRLNSLFITELAREQISDFDRLFHPESYNTPAANERLTRLHLL